MEKYLIFIDAADDAGMWPVSKLAAVTCAGDGAVLVRFASGVGGGFKKFAAAFAKLMEQLNNTQTKEMVVVADEDNSVYFNSIISGTVTITAAA